MGTTNLLTPSLRLLTPWQHMYLRLGPYRGQGNYTAHGSCPQAPDGHSAPLWERPLYLGLSFGFGLKNNGPILHRFLAFPAAQGAGKVVADAAQELWQVPEHHH